jgi:hypothetical protein
VCASSIRSVIGSCAPPRHSGTIDASDSSRASVPARTASSATVATNTLVIDARSKRVSIATGGASRALVTVPYAPAKRTWPPLAIRTTAAL